MAHGLPAWQQVYTCHVDVVPWCALAMGEAVQGGGAAWVAWQGVAVDLLSFGLLTRPLIWSVQVASCQEPVDHDVGLEKLLIAAQYALSIELWKSKASKDQSCSGSSQLKNSITQLLCSQLSGQQEKTAVPTQRDFGLIFRQLDFFF